MSTPARRRLMKDLFSLQIYKETVYAQPLENDLMTWVSIIEGPSGTPYEGGYFTLMLLFDEKYPFSPPNVRFLSKMFHPNIYFNGDLCLDIIKTKWSPTFDIFSLLISIQSLLADPNCTSPANIKAATLLQNDKHEYLLQVEKTVLDSIQGFQLHLVDQ